MSNQTNNPRLLETAPVPQLLWKFALPAIISTLTTSLYNLIDRIFIGQGAGPMAISGLALSLPIMNFLQAFGTLVGVGASTRISIVLGMGDRDWAERILGNALVLTVIIWGALTLFCLGLLYPLLGIFGGSEKTIPYASDYLYIVIPGYIFSNLAYSFCNIIRASGSPTRSMVIMLIGVGVNLVLDPLFIFGFGMGIRGAAIATVLSMFVTSIFTMQFFMRKDAFIRFKRSTLKLKRTIVRNILSIGMSPFLMNIAASAVAVILNRRLVLTGGDLAVGAYGIINSYGILFVMFVIGLCQGMQPIVGFNYGAKKMDRAKHAFFLSIKVGTAITTFGFLMMELFPDAAARVFTSDAELTQIARNGFRYVFLLFPFVGFQIVTSNFFQSLGKVHLSIFLSLSRQVLFLIPALYVCSYFFGLDGVWAATAVADFFAILVTLFILHRQLKHIK
ncbi:MAG: MATE family efflux transporter [Bacteroides sp.]|nr:MATE family efflux transporter [Ruminococcus flavefaciens]MCM1555290.1 MATE family efflux transporter [Bacteroides sp.]